MNLTKHQRRFAAGVLLSTISVTSAAHADIDSGNFEQWSTWITNSSAPAFEVPPPDSSGLATELAAVKDLMSSLDEDGLERARYWAAGPANYRWMEILLEEIAKGPPSPFKGRNLALMNVAIYDAVLIASKAKKQHKRARPHGIETVVSIPRTSSHPSARAAAAAAAAGVLSHLYPEQAAHYSELMLEAAESRVAAGVNYPSDVDTGLSIGKAVAEQVIHYAASDGSDSKFTGERPTGPDKFKGERFVYPAAGDWKPWTVKSTDAYLPAAPPAFGSEQLAKEVAALKNIERPLPVAIQGWVNHSVYRAYHWWYERLATGAFEQNWSDDLPMAALAYATVATSNHDAVLACFNAKYTYWMIRPAQLDDSIPTLFPNPPHPSYPAAHSCSTRSLANVIGHFLPAHRPVLDDAAEAAGNSRLIAGIHFPSDKKAGDQIGSEIADAAIGFVKTLTE